MNESLVRSGLTIAPLNLQISGDNDRISKISLSFPFFAAIKVNEKALLAGLQWFWLEKFQKGHL